MNDKTHSNDELSDVFSAEFSFPDLTGKSVLVVGVGGGCDIISAYGIAQTLKQHGAQKTVYANTKRRVEPSLESISDHVFRVPPIVRTIVPEEPTHGGTRIDRSMPRGDDGCPLIIRLDNRPDAQRMLVHELASLGFDMVFSVDTGADSIVRDASSGARGRDKIMMQLLGRLSLPGFHIVVAPGCDGETKFEDLVATFRELAAAGEYAGCFSLEPVVSFFARLSERLDRVRTPNIIVDAFADRLQTVTDHPDLMVVPRGIHPEIPRTWLTRAFVIKP